MSERAPLPAIEEPERGRVLVLAPHADDDVLGCGGTSCLHADAGDPVHVLVVFNGLAGDPEGRYDPAEYQRRRQDEARAGGRHLGLSDYEFWAYPEGHEPSPAELVEAARALAARVDELGCDVVYAPWIGEHHLDHHVLARVTRMALALCGFRGRAWGYEVWTPLVAERIVDITRVYPRKEAAMREHRSQLEYSDLVHKALALSANRAVYLPPASLYGEAFARLGPPSAQDRALLERTP